MSGFARGWWLAGLLAGVVGLLAAGCTETGGDPNPPGTLGELIERVAEVRGLEAPDGLDVRYVARGDLPDLLEELLTDADREYFANTTTLYRLLGYIDNDQTYYDVYRSFGQGSILGLYAPDRDTLWVVHADGEEVAFESLSSGQIGTLAHEVVHALQDYHYKLDEVADALGDDLDRTLAWAAVVEGDAVTHAGIFSDRYLRLPVAPGAGGEPMLLAGSPSSAVLAQVSDAVMRELYFPYLAGAEWIEGVRKQHGIEAINEMVANPPDGTAYVLHPERLEGGWKPEDVSLPDLAAILGDGWEQRSGGQFGEFHTGNYLAQELTRRDSENGGDGWAGDRYAVYERNDEAVAVFRLVFEDEEQAKEFDQLHAAFLESARAEKSAADGLQVYTLEDGDVVARAGVRGREVVFAIGTDRDATAQAVGGVLE